MSRVLVLAAAAALAGAWLAGGCEDNKMATQKVQHIYKVQAGDTDMMVVSQKVYGDSKDWEAIAKANPQMDPKKLEVGQELLIPVKVDAAGKRVEPVSCERKSLY